MSLQGILIDSFANRGVEPVLVTSTAKIFPGVRAIIARLLGPFSLGTRSRLGPDVMAGRYLGINSDSYVA